MLEDISVLEKGKGLLTHATKWRWLIMVFPICKGKKVMECPEYKGKGSKDGGFLVGKYKFKYCKGTGKIKCSCV